MAEETMGLGPASAASQGTPRRGLHHQAQQNYAQLDSVGPSNAENNAVPAAPRCGGSRNIRQEYDRSCSNLRLNLVHPSADDARRFSRCVALCRTTVNLVNLLIYKWPPIASHSSLLRSP